MKQCAILILSLSYTSRLQCKCGAILVCAPDLEGIAFSVSVHLTGVQKTWMLDFASLHRLDFDASPLLVRITTTTTALVSLLAEMETDSDLSSPENSSVQNPESCVQVFRKPASDLAGIAPVSVECLARIHWLPLTRRNHVH
jgi:hypothetical protein